MTRGLFLAFEGIDASGKSTQARRVAAQRSALFTFEPGDTALGAEVRRWLLDAATPMVPPTEALLMLADRAHHVATVIEPALRAGTDVVTDRFLASTLAYQGFGRGLDLDELRSATTLAVGATLPDLTILLDVPVALSRRRRPASGRDRFDAAGDEFMERVRQGFLGLAVTSGEWLVVDGSRPESEVAAEIDARLEILWRERRA